MYVSIALYLAMIAILPRVFQGRRVAREKLRKVLACWNLFLAVYSFMGAIRTVPHLLWYISTSTFKETVCNPPYYVNGDGATGLWVMLFTLSKVVELFDTLFICLAGKKPIFLHWYVPTLLRRTRRRGGGGDWGGGEESCLATDAHSYAHPCPHTRGGGGESCLETNSYRVTLTLAHTHVHRYHHVSVLYFAWVAHEAAHPGLYFIAMNYTVHSVMYSYYFLMACDAWPKSIK